MTPAASHSRSPDNLLPSLPEGKEPKQTGVIRVVVEDMKLLPNSLKNFLVDVGKRAKHFSIDFIQPAFKDLLYWGKMRVKLIPIYLIDLFIILTLGGAVIGALYWATNQFAPYVWPPPNRRGSPRQPSLRERTKDRLLNYYKSVGERAKNPLVKSLPENTGRSISPWDGEVKVPLARHADMGGPSF